MIIEKKENNNIDVLVSDATEAYMEYHLNALEIDVTNLCPCRCPFCFLGNDHYKYKQELSTETIKRVIDEAIYMGTYYLSFSGGEPFARDDFMEILKYAKDKGAFISFVSSLQIPSKEEMIKLGDMGISRVLVSFHSVDPDNYAKIFGVERKMYYSAFDNIKTLVESKTPVGISVTTFSENYNELDDILNLFMGIGIKKEDVHFNTLIEGKNKVREIRGQESICGYLKKNPHLKANVLSKTRTHETSFLCSAGRSALVIRPDGSAIPCGFMNIVAGDIYKQSLLEIWNNSSVLKMLRSFQEYHFEKCIQCPEVQTCPVCMASNINETGNPFTPSDEYCDFHIKINHSFISD